MWLSIVLVLASGASMQQADNAAADTAKQFSVSQHDQTADEGPAVLPSIQIRRGNKQSLDPGIVMGAGCNPEQRECVCASITAYVFSDGENPKLKYVTHCPNLELPQATQTQGQEENRQQPAVRRIKYR
jgi:hypothetical protein